MITTKSAEEHLLCSQWSAMEWLHNHELLGEAYWDEGRGARWLIGRPDTAVFRCEIIAGIFGSLVVHGDFDTCRFAQYGDRFDAWSRLRWMADCRDVGYYVAQKASIGMGRVSDAHVYDEDVARYDMDRHIRDYAEDGYDPSVVEILKEAASYVEDEHRLRNFLYEHDRGHDFWELTIGKTLRPHVVISHVALNKCAWLLRERHGDEGPPACRRKP